MSEEYVFENHRVPNEVLDHSYEAVEIWMKAIANGESPRFAEMVALRCPPGLKGTDSQNFHGTANDPFPNMPTSLKKYYADYFRKQGVDFNGKVYKMGLVRKGFGGLKPDPQALVGSTSDVRDVLRRNNWAADGMVKEQSVEIDAPTFLDGDYRAADDLVHEHAAREVIEDHGGRIKKKAFADLKEKVRAKLEGKT
jgi:hypothetical protein